MSLSLDGSASGTGGASASATLTTTKSPDIIYVIVTIDAGSTNLPTASGLTFTRRIADLSFTGGKLATFYAVATSPLTSVVITETPTGNTVVNLVVFGISGANTSSPFDPHTGIPATATGTNTSPTVNITTTNANDFIIGAEGDNSGGSPATAGTGYTLIASIQDSNQITSEMGEYKIVSAPQTNLVVNAVADSSVTGWAMVADAIVAGGHTPVNASSLLSSSLLWTTTYKRGETRPLLSQPILTTYSIRNPRRLNISTLNTSTDKLRSPSRSIVSNPVIQTSIFFVKNLQRSLASSLSILSNVIRTPMRQLLSTLMILNVLSSVRVKVQTLMANLGMGTQALKSVQRSIISQISTLTSVGRFINRALSSLIAFLTSLSAAKSGIKTLVLSAQLLLSTSLLRNIVRALFINVVIQTTTQMARALQLTVTLQFASNAIRSLSRIMTSSIKVLTSMLSSVISAGGKVITLTVNLVFSTSRLSSLIRSLISQITTLSSFVRQMSRPLMSVVQIGTFVQRSLFSMRQISSGLSLISSSIRSPSRLLMSIIAFQSTIFRNITRILLIGISINSNMIRILSKSLLITMSFSSNVAIITQRAFKIVKIKLQSLVNLIKVKLS